MLSYSRQVLWLHSIGLNWWAEGSKLEVGQGFAATGVVMNGDREQSRTVKFATVAAALLGASVSCPAVDQTKATQQQTAVIESLYIKVRLDETLKLSSLKQGDTVEGKLVRDVYSSYRELFAAGSPIRLTVDHMEKRRRIPNDHWPWVVKAFTPRHQMYPVFKGATVSDASGDGELKVSLVSASRRREVRAQPKKNEAGAVELSTPEAANGLRETTAPTIVLEAWRVEKPGNGALSSTPSQRESGSAPDLSSLKTLPAGTVSKILLLDNVSASRSTAGDVIHARLLEPVLLNSSVVLPAGTLFEGRIAAKTAPKWGSRAASLLLTFTGLTLPGGNLIPIAASLRGAELDRRSHTKIDAEGQLQGERPGKAWMAINIGVTAGLAKEADDTTQLIIEAIVSTATDASTAGVARIVSTCVSGVFMVSRHGRDVVLPRFTEMNIALDRPLSVRVTTETPKPFAAPLADGK